MIRLDFLGYSIACTIILADWLTKNLVLGVTHIEGLIAPVTPFFSIVLVWNHGISFGLLKLAETSMPYILSGVAVSICIWLNHWLRDTLSRWTAICLGLIIGGAMGNVIDRLTYGAVVDFLDFHITIAGKAHHWPAFNLADSAICVGVIMLLLGGRHKSA